ncbi:MAG: cytochrome b [Pseudomonadota bacterium]
MAVTNSERSWGWVSRIIHWGTAGVLLWTMGLGIYMTNVVTDPFEQFPLFQTHKSWGFTVFILALLRVVWLLFSPKRPELPEGSPWYERLGSKASHALLYLFIFLMPLSGWVMSAASPLQDLLGIENMVFGLFAMPDPWVPGVEWVEKVAKQVHFFSGLALFAVLLLHVAAALKHHFINRDDILKRMTYGR